MTENHIPPGWAPAPIGELCHLINGKAFKPKDWTLGGLPIVRIQNLNRRDKPFNYFDGEVEEKFKIESGELLFAWSGTPGSSFGAHIWDRGPAVLNQHIFRVLIDESCLDKEFFRQALNERLNSFIAQAHGGVGLAHITKPKFERTQVSIPPLNEQRRIVQKIEALNARSRRAREALEQIPTLLERFRQSVLAAAFRGDLTADWRKQNPDVEPASVLLERIRAERRRRWEEDYLAKQRAKGKEPKNDSWKARYEEPEPLDTGDLPDLPNGWAWASAQQVCHPIASGSTPSRDLMQDDEGEVPFLKVYNLTHDGRLDFSVRPTFVSKDTHYEKLGRSVVLPGDVLINIVGPPLGKVSLVPSDHSEWNMNQAIVLFRVLNGVCNRWLLWNLLSPQAIARMNSLSMATAGQFNLSLTKCRNLPVPVPPAAEQQEIARLVDSLMERLLTMREASAEWLQGVEHLDQSVLAKAFRGELVPQDPNEKPASVLLERIRAERGEQPKRTSSKKKAKRQGQLSASGNPEDDPPTPPPAPASPPKKKAKPSASNGTLLKKALEALRRDALHRIADAHEIELADRRSLEAAREGILGAGIGLETVLEPLKREELKAICRALDLDDGGRSKDEIRDRIVTSLGSSNTPSALRGD